MSTCVLILLCYIRWSMIWPFIPRGTKTSSIKHNNLQFHFFSRTISIYLQC
jgi:hypothetical protein